MKPPGVPGEGTGAVLASGGGCGRPSLQPPGIAAPRGQAHCGHSRVPWDVGDTAWGQLCTDGTGSQSPVRGWRPPLPALPAPWHSQRSPAERGRAGAPQEHPCLLGSSRLVSLVTLG